MTTEVLPKLRLRDSTTSGPRKLLRTLTPETTREIKVKIATTKKFRRTRDSVLKTF